jgi:hypothetical protein
MSEYKFRESEKVAIWTADGKKCFYERTPIHYCDLQIDHIVPERISDSELSKLRPLLPQNFEINSIENWVACHQGCNLRKGAFVFETNTLLYYLEMAKKRAAEARKILEEFSVQRENDRLLSTLAVRIEQGYLSRETVLSAIRNVPETPNLRSDPWVISFGVNFLDPLPVDAPERDPELSDWLIRRLERDLAASGAIFQTIDNERSGETVSVRCAFWVFDFDRITEAIDFCWDVLAIQKYSELFGVPADEHLDRAVVARYHEIVDSDSGPIGISACPNCGSNDLEYSSFNNERDTLHFARCRKCGHSQSS